MEEFWSRRLTKASHIVSRMTGPFRWEFGRQDADRYTDGERSEVVSMTEIEAISLILWRGKMAYIYPYPEKLNETEFGNNRMSCLAKGLRQ